MMNHHSSFYKSRSLTSDTNLGPDRERWLLSYADLLTLLLAFFVVMYSMSDVDVTKLSSISESFSGDVKSNKQVPPSGLSEFTNNINGVREDSLEEKPKDNFEENPKEELENEMLATIFDEDVAVNNDEGEWVLITMDSSVLFRSGSAEVLAINALKDIALSLSVYDGEIIVEGHTDATPISTERFPSNWELSAARAAAVVRLLEAAGISSIRLNATGFANTRPLVSNETAEGRERNRRVVFRLKRSKLNQIALATASDAKKLDDEKRSAAELNYPSVQDFESEFDLDNVSPELLIQLLQQIEREEANSSTEAEVN